MNSLLTDEEKLEKKRAYKRNYVKNYRKTHDRTLWDLLTRQKPEYHQRELLRMKNRNDKVRDYLIFRKSMPHYLTE